MSRAIVIFCLIFLISCSKEKQTETAAADMKKFVINIAEYARQYDTDFIIIPQNGIELAFQNTQPDNGLDITYLNSVDGFGIEELFYNGSYAFDKERLSMLQQLKNFKKIMVSEYVSDRKFIADAYYRNYQEGFICFVRDDNNYHYLEIPDTIPNENSSAINHLSQAQNFLYLISTDNFSSKEEMIKAISATNFDVVLIDLFFNEIELKSSDINQLKIKANGSPRLVISYLSIGSAEKYRYYWKKEWTLHHPHWLKKKYEGYKDEYWVEFWEKEWQDIIFGNDDSYLKKILNAGFDGAYLDNVEAYYFLYHND